MLLEKHQCRLLTGTFLLMFSVLITIWTPTEMLLYDRLHMHSFSLPFKWWRDTPDQAMMEMYIFNVTNSEEFMNGTDAKLNMQEVGPLVFLEKIVHLNVTHNDNNTLSYIVKNVPMYLPDKNTIDLSSTMIIPNWAVLGTASYVNQRNMLYRTSFNLLYKTLNTEPFIKKTLEEILWNFTQPFTDAVNTIAPSMLPYKNTALMPRFYPVPYQSYFGSENTVTVYIGPEHGHENFFLIDKYDGSSSLPFDDQCDDSLLGSTDGVIFAQYLKKGGKLKFYRQNVCRNIVLDYESETTKYGMDAYLYNIPENCYTRTEPLEKDCYKGDPVLINGLSDVSKCYFGIPLALSFPHFLYGDPSLRTHVTGLNPDVETHSGYMVVEPKFGVPLETKISSQCNVAIGDLSSMDESLQKFSGVVVPMFWVNLVQKGIPDYIVRFLYFAVVILPIIQKVFFFFTIAFNIHLAYTLTRRWKKKEHREEKIMDVKLRDV